MRDYGKKAGTASRGRWASALAALALAALALLAASASASKEAISYLGGSSSGSGSKGGEFNNPRAIAVNSSGAGPADAGDIYVADGDNNRIQRFDSEGNFISAWGANLLTPPVNEVQTLTVEASAGTYVLRFNGAATGPLPYNATASTVEGALRGLSSVGGSNLSVEGSGASAKPFKIAFRGIFTATNVPATSAETSNLSGSASFATETQGSGAYEVCTVAAECLRGAATGAANVADNDKNGSLSAPQSVAVDEDTGNVYVSDRANRRINEYDGVGSFIRAFGFGVDASSPGAAYEVCPATHRCQSGIAGSGAGQIGATEVNGSLGIAISLPDGEAASGKVYLTDSGNRRVSVYGVDGQSPSSFGSAAQFSLEQPRQIAVDSRGILYASNAKDGGEVERYDSEDANGGGIGFLAPIVAAANESQTVKFVGFANKDTFTLTCPGGETTDPIEWNEELSLREAVRAALEAKCGVGDFSVLANGSDPIVTHQGTFAETDVAQMTCTTTSGAGSCEVTEEVDGHTGTLLLGSTSGLAVDPDTDGGGPDADVLQVLRGPSSLPPSGPAAVQQLGPANAPGLTAAPAAVDDTHGAGAGFTFVNGLGLDDSSGHLFVSANDHRVYILDELPPPGVTLDPIAIFDSHSATFTGTVDPEGAETTYRFEYVDDAEFEANGFNNAAQVPVAGAHIGKGESPVAVEQQSPGHLVAGTTYHVRLVAKRVFGGAETIAGPLAFTTPNHAPTIEGATATGIGIEEATLRGAIDPENEAVSDYRFEWGSDESYGNSTPAGTLPAGVEAVAVSAQLSGLVPGATYHYRLVAANGTGTSTGTDRSFTTPAGPPQFPQRGYEVVSNLPTGGIPIVPGYSQPEINEDGTRVVFKALQPLPGSFTPVPWDQVSGEFIYQSLRRPDHWNLTQSKFSTGGGGAESHLAGEYAVAADAAHILTQTNDGLDPDDRNGLHLNVYQQQPDGSVVWISRDPRVPVGTPQMDPGDALIPPGGPNYSTLNGASGGLSMSADGSTVVLYSNRQLLDADTTPRSGTQLDPYALYKWTDGQLSFIGKRPDGSVPPNGSTLSQSGAGGPASTQGTVSRDGSRVVFGAGRIDSVTRLDGRGHTLYIQTDGQPTVDALKEGGVPPIPASQLWDPTYRGASADNSRVFYTTQSRLTTDSGGQNLGSNTKSEEDLYLYDINADEVRDLTPRLDGIDNPEIDPAASDRGGALGMPAVSEDGKRIYLVARGRYDVAPSPQGQLPAAGSPNLYMAELDGFEEPLELRFVATLGEGDSASWQASWGGRAAYASPDGSVLAFGSRADLVAGRPTGGTDQMYVYDARTATLACASCPADGSLPAGDVDELLTAGGGSDDTVGARWQFNGGQRHWVSEDGTVFFDTPTQLLPDDHNSAGDVYEYLGGELRLVSGGTGNALAKFENASPDGSSVIFTTSQALAPQDDEPGTFKLYAARIGGGFPYSAPTPPCDLGAGACEGAGTSAPQGAGAGTAVFEGPGNLRPKRAKRCPKGKHKVHRKGKVRCVKRHQQSKRHAKHKRRAGR